MEVRKIEVYLDGSCGFACAIESVGGAMLGLESVPSMEEIAADPEFEPIEISPEHFERVWVGRHGIQRGY